MLYIQYALRRLHPHTTRDLLAPKLRVELHMIKLALLWIMCALGYVWITL